MSRSAAVLRSGVSAARYRLTGHRMPLSVTWAVTARCDALCTTCAIPIGAGRELGTEAAVALIDAMAAAGTVRVGLTGGEPLVRADLGALVDRLAAHGIWVTLETNGHAYPARADALRGVGRLVVALDGDEAAHDANREPGAWRLAMAGMVEARRRGVDVHTVTTLTRANLGALDAVLDLADAHGFVANFQLLHGQPFLSAHRAAELRAPDDAVKKALRLLLEARAAGRRVGTTEKALRYLLSWPGYGEARSPVPHEDVHCMAGQLYCAVQPDGALSPCGLLAAPGHGRTPDAPGDFEAAFAALRDNPCRACTSTALTEYNYLYNLNAPTLFERAAAFRGAGSPAAGPSRGPA